MKVLLTTIVDNVNYGTYLQAYATVKLLEDRGCEVDVLNYVRPHLTPQYMLSKAKERGIKSYIRGYINVKLDTWMKKNLKKFLLDKVHTTPQFSNWVNFRKSLPKYDLYVVGSDQVWNTEHNHGIDSVFYFEGISGKKVAYASSVGLESFKKDDYSEINKLLKDFSHISVRESFGVEALKTLGIKEVSQVLDPTLMLTKEDWRKISKKSFRKTEPYLLVYSVEVNKDKETIEIARKIAKDRGLKLYLISPYIKFNSKLKVDRLFTLADTDTFLALFMEADYVVVSSFHGTAFAINFGCQFVTVAPERFSSRVNSLLKLLNIENRYIREIEDIPRFDINYQEVTKKLDIEKNISNSILSFLIS